MSPSLKTFVGIIILLGLIKAGIPYRKKR